MMEKKNHRSWTIDRRGNGRRFDGIRNEAEIAPENQCFDPTGKQHALKLLVKNENGTFEIGNIRQPQLVILSYT